MAEARTPQTTSARLSVTEYAVLGALAEAPTHGFAIAKLLRPDGEIGRVLTVPHSLVYRALDRLVESGLAEPVATESGDGPNRVIHRVTRQGEEQLDRWLREPVDHIRQLRIEFLLKLILAERRGHPAADLVRAQRETLASTFAALGGPTDDPVELWRRHNAAAAEGYLRDLERLRP